MYRVSHSPGHRLSRAPLALLALVCAAMGTRSLAAQSAGRPGAALAVLNLAFFGEHATELQPDDSLLAHVATAAMRDYLGRADGVALIDSARTAAAQATPRTRAAARGKPCNVIVACARAVGRELGVRWMVMAKVSKTTDLIWVLSGQLIDVPTGKLVYDDVYELKGRASDIVPKGAQVFAQRIAQRITTPTP